MRKARIKSVFGLLIFLALVAGGIYVAMFGVGKNETGKASDIPLGLDLQGGLSVTYEITNENPSQEEINITIDKLQRRVDGYSSEGEVYQEGDERITVEIPVDTEKYDAHAILEDLGQPGQLFFLDETNYALWAEGKEFVAAVDGADIKNSDVMVDNSGMQQEYVVGVVFNESGKTKFGEATAANIGKPIYIIYDGAVVSAPIVSSAITQGECTISGQGWTLEDAQQLSNTIKIGALPLELKQLQYNIVGAKLGKEAVSTSLMAGAIGFGIICLLMIIIYLVPGFIAALALVAYVVLLLLILSIRGITLTLPGIAGIILSVGMAVDANVIIFTRIKEEIAAGENVRNAVKAGFSKALSAILDGNITTLIATFVLMALGTGSIKGFAVTLMVGIILSMFTALAITRMLLNIAVNLGIKSKKLYGVAKKPKVRNYVKNSKLCFIISAAIIIVGLVFLPINKSKDGQILNFALEFTGGTSTTVEFTEAYDLHTAEEEIAPVIAEAIDVQVGTIQIQIVEGTNQVIFKTAELSDEQAQALQGAMSEKFNASVVSSNGISSTISGEMRTDAIVAIIISSILMLIYIAIRFSDVRFGASAVIALIHDVMVVFAIYAVGQLSVGNTFIACMLTIVGYSINATIITFDRIRENIKLMDVAKDGYDHIVNTSIAQTFSRSVYTSLTTFVMVLVLYIMGVASLKEFTFTLMAGIVCGAYSSICITGPLWLVLKKKFKKKEAQ
ncbi:MAG: protein translocase subunit SecD [Lachnospiraceae bacterium]|nr:protein translocase subunit SecD [Lachnospiraceae bacterium]